MLLLRANTGQCPYGQSASTYDFQITIFGDDRYRAQTGVNQIITHTPFFPQLTASARLINTPQKKTKIFVTGGGIVHIVKLARIPNLHAFYNINNFLQDVYV
jgi:hypothetical protein